MTHTNILPAQAHLDAIAIAVDDADGEHGTYSVAADDVVAGDEYPEVVAVEVEIGVNIRSREVRVIDL